MPGVSTDQKKAIGTTLANNKAVIAKIDVEAKKVHDLLGADSVDAAKLATLKTHQADLLTRHEKLEVGGLDDKRYQTLKTDIANHNADTTKMLNRVTAEAKQAALDGWKRQIVDTAGHAVDLSKFDNTLQGVLKKIVQDGGAGSHGGTTLSGSHGACLHWVSGSARIFGKYGSGKLTLIGTGKHAGTDSTYKVDLLAGGTATAKTS